MYKGRTRTDETIGKQEEKQVIELKFEKTYRYDRVKEPCCIAIPFEKGRLFQEQKLCIRNEKAESIPFQVRITSRWSDRSIRWMLVRFQADLKANQAVSYDALIEEIAEPREMVSTLLTEKKGRMVIETGGLSVTLKQPDEVEGIFEQISYRENQYGAGDFSGPVISDGEGREYSFIIKKWNVVENGPLFALVQGEGVQKASDGKQTRAELRLSFYAGKDWFELSWRIFNDSKEVLHLKRAEFSVKVPAAGKVTNYAASSNYKTSYDIGENGRTAERVIDSGYLLYEANEHIAEVFYGTLFAAHENEKTGLCATVYQAQQNYPKAVLADTNGITIKIVPEGMDEVKMQPGMAREQKMLLHFYEAGTSKEEFNNRSLIYQMPDRPVLRSEVFHKAGVFMDVFTDKKLPEVERFLIGKADSHARCYGMLNWGDAPDPGYTQQGRGGGQPVWTNNEYDYPHACALQYARTGIRRFLDYVLVSVSHWMDVDVCHYSDSPLLLGGQWEHTRGHVIDGSIVCSHQWVEGLFDYYHFTGDERAYLTAVGIGENILRLLETPVFQQKGEINARETGWAMRSLTALYIETNEEKWLSKCDWIVGHFRDWSKEYGGWLSPYTDNTVIRVPFMISVAVGSLMRYYRVRPDEEIKRMILDAVDDLMEHAYMPELEVFYYKELPSLSRLGTNTLLLEALAVAFELTGNKEYLKAGRRTFLNDVKKGTGSLGGAKRIVGDAVIQNGEGTKTFAQSFIPLAVYYKAVMECGGILDDETYRQ